MDRDDPVEDHCDHKAEKAQGKVIEERVAYHFCSTPYATEATNGKENQVPDRSSTLWLPLGAINEERPCFTRADYSSVADIHQLFDGRQWVQDLARREQLSGPQEHRRAPRQEQGLFHAL